MTEAFRGDSLLQSCNQDSICFCGSQLLCASMSRRCVISFDNSRSKTTRPKNHDKVTRFSIEIVNHHTYCEPMLCHNLPDLPPRILRAIASSQITFAQKTNPPPSSSSHPNNQNPLNSKTPSSPSPRPRSHPLRSSRPPPRHSPAPPAHPRQACPRYLSRPSPSARRRDLRRRRRPRPSWRLPRPRCPRSR